MNKLGIKVYGINDYYIEDIYFQVNSIKHYRYYMRSKHYRYNMRRYINHNYFGIILVKYEK